MIRLKRTHRARVFRGFDGLVVKYFESPRSLERFQNERRVLSYLNEMGCPFVPRLIESDERVLSTVTEYAGEQVERLSEERICRLFGELAEYDVRHDDPAWRKILYHHTLGRFMIINFEFAKIVPSAMGISPPGKGLQCQLDGIADALMELEKSILSE